MPWFALRTAADWKASSSERSPRDKCLPVAPTLRMDSKIFCSRVNWYGANG